MAPFKLARDLKPGDTITRDTHYGHTDDYTRIVVLLTEVTAGLLRMSGNTTDGAQVVRYYQLTDQLTVDSADPFEGLS